MRAVVASNPGLVKPCVNAPLSLYDAYMAKPSAKILQTEHFPAEVIRTRRRTAAINVREGKVYVRVPLRFPEAAVREFLDIKSGWVIDKLTQQRQVQRANRRAFVTGERFTYLGDDCRLVVMPGESDDTALEDGQLRVTYTGNLPDQNDIRERLIQWYRKRAAEVLSARADLFTPAVGAAPVKITIRTCKSRWGSCSAAGRVMFNWKIIMAPQSVIDYLVVHELCHLLEPNHSARFWEQVGKVLPDYRVQRQWLWQNGRYLDFDA